MTYLRLTLLSFIPLICFFVLPISGYVKDTIYTPRVILLVSMAVMGNLTLFYLYSGRKSLLEALREVLRPRPLKLAVFSYVSWLCVSSAFSVMPGYSWLGHPYTQFGVVSVLSCLAISYLYSEAVNIQLAIRIMSICILLMSLVTIIEAAGYQPLKGLVQNPNIIYPAAFVGHRPHLGGWFAMTMLMPVFFYRSREYDAWFWVWIISATVGLALSTTTSATVGVGIGLSVWLIYVCLRSRGDFQSALLVIAAFGLSVALLPNITKAIGNALELHAPQLKDYNSTGSFKPRLYMWKSALNASLERPIVGWGTDTFGYQVFRHLTTNDAEKLFRAELGFGKEYKIEHKGISYYAYKTQGKDRDQQTGSLLYIRPHNFFFDELYSNGFVGTILLILMIGLILVKISSLGPYSNLIYFIVACLPYFIYLQAWFYITSVTPMFFILLGMMIKDIKLYGNDRAGI